MDNKEKKFNEEQLKARDAIKNSVVSAGAGSGKTTVLAQRYLQLVTKYNYEVSEILTLTFTKKATVEMSSRIYSVLKKECPEKAADFYTANIKTLDSYCNTIAKQGAHLFGLSPDYSVDETLISEKISSLALPFLLEHRDNPALKKIGGTKLFEEIAAKLLVTPMIQTSTIAFPIDFKADLLKQYDFVISKWNEAYKNSYDAYCRLKNEIETFGGNRNSKTFLTISENVQSAKFDENFELTREFLDKGDGRKLAKEYDSFYKASSKKPGNLAGSENLRIIIDELREYSTPLAQIANYCAGIKIIKGLIPLFEEFQDKINDFKRIASILTYNDIQSMARKILMENKEIRQMEKNKYKAIMIDEFQDNNGEQKDILFMLAEKLNEFNPGIPSIENLCPDKLFFVGDEKQSIYLFRGADVSVFRGLSEDFKDGNLSMNTNFRSHPALIGTFNTLFGGESYPPKTGDKKIRPSIFTPASSQEKTEMYEARYSSVKLSPAAEKIVKEDFDKAYEPRTVIALYNSDSGEDESKFYTKEEAEAEWVAIKIKELLENDSSLTSSDIAILFRNYKVQSLYEKSLLRHGINFSPEVIVDFFADGPVNDFYAFLRVCVFPNDTLNYMKLLCSPFVNLSQEEATALLSQRKEGQEAFQEDGEKILPQEALDRFKKAGIFFNQIKEKSKTQSITETITELWYESGYRFETLWNEQVEMYADLYDKLFELARQADQNANDLSQFIDTLRKYISKKLEGIDVPMEQKNGVSLLSIFKSKGLEYKVVFVCATHSKPREKNSKELIFVNSKYGLIVNTEAVNLIPAHKNIFFDYYAEQVKAEESAELKRICYVALTRAKERLFITAGKYESEKSPGDHPGSILETLLPAINYYSENSEEKAPFIIEEISNLRREFLSRKKRPNNLNTKLTVQKELEKIYSRYLDEDLIKQETLKSKYILPSSLHPLDDESNWKSADDSPKQTDIPYSEINKIVLESIPKGPASDGKPRFTFANFGTIAHAFLQAGAEGQEGNCSTKDITGLNGSEKKLDTILNICRKMTQDFLNSPTGKEVLASKWHREEYPFKLKLGDLIVKGSIDLVYENKDGSYTLVDYKTNQSIEPELYYNQLGAYAEAFAQMKGISSEKIKTVLFYLRFAQAVDITENCKNINLQEAVKKLQEDDYDL